MEHAKALAHACGNRWCVRVTQIMSKHWQFTRVVLALTLPLTLVQLRANYNPWIMTPFAVNKRLRNSVDALRYHVEIILGVETDSIGAAQRAPGEAQAATSTGKERTY